MGSRVALLWHQAEDQTKARRARLDGVFRALTELGAVPEAVMWADETAVATRERLLACNGVLVWVNPITNGRDRSVLDGVLREVATAGVWVSAHPDVIDTLGTKEVLYRTRAVGWGGDVGMYRDLAAARLALPARLASGPVVLKRLRGHDGLGVWKLALVAPEAEASVTSIVRVQHAYDGATHYVPLDRFLESLATYLDAGGAIVDQRFFPRVAEGMVRCYLSGPNVAGFAEHIPRGFVSPVSDTAETTSAAPALGFQKVMYGSDAPAFRDLRISLERHWIPAMLQLLGIDAGSLPAIWDADFLRGFASSKDGWVLCEINASCVSPFPDAAADPIACTTLERVLERAR